MLWVKECVEAAFTFQGIFQMLFKPQVFNNWGRQHWHEIFFSTVKLFIRRHQPACLTILALCIIQCHNLLAVIRIREGLQKNHSSFS